MKDVAFTAALSGDTMAQDPFPDAPVTQLDDASHYIQEDAHERIVPELLSFLAGCGRASQA